MEYRRSIWREIRLRKLTCIDILQRKPLENDGYSKYYRGNSAQKSFMHILKSYLCIFLEIFLQSFAKNDDIFDAEVDDDSDGEQQQDVNALENTCNKTSDVQQTAQKDEDMDDEVSLKAPESSVSKTKEDEGDGELKKDDVQPPSEDKEIENDRTVKDDIFDDEGSTKADDSEDNDSEKENEEEDEESLKQSQKKRDKVSTNKAFVF